MTHLEKGNAINYEVSCKVPVNFKIDFRLFHKVRVVTDLSLAFTD